jgi:hypothetical protein
MLLPFKIDSNLLVPVIDWANDKYKDFVPNGFGRQFGVLQRKDLKAPKEVWEIKDIIVDGCKLQGAEQEPSYQDYCGYITEGGAIHKHTDPNNGKKIHTRFNVMVSKPEQGGEPVQEDKVIEVEEGSIWRCNAGVVKHWCNTVVGSKPRIVLSYGFLLNLNE